MVMVESFPVVKSSGQKRSPRVEVLGDGFETQSGRDQRKFKYLPKFSGTSRELLAKVKGRSRTHPLT